MAWATGPSRTACFAFRCLMAEPGRSTQASKRAAPSHGSSLATSAFQRTGEQSIWRVRRRSPTTGFSSWLATSYPTRTRLTGRQLEGFICPRHVRQVRSSRGTSGLQAGRFASACTSGRCLTKGVARLQTRSSLASVAHSGYSPPPSASASASPLIVVLQRRDLRPGSAHRLAVAHDPDCEVGKKKANDSGERQENGEAAVKEKYRQASEEQEVEAEKDSPQNLSPRAHSLTLARRRPSASARASFPRHSGRGSHSA